MSTAEQSVTNVAASPTLGVIEDIKRISVVAGIMIFFSVAVFRPYYGAHMTGKMPSPRWTWRFGAIFQATLVYLTIYPIMLHNEGTLNWNGFLAWLSAPWSPQGPPASFWWEKFFHYFVSAYFVKDFVPGVCVMDSSVALHHIVSAVLVSFSMLGFVDVGHNCVHLCVTLMEMGSLGLSLRAIWPQSRALNTCSLVVMVLSNVSTLAVVYWCVTAPMFAHVPFAIKASYAIVSPILAYARQTHTYKTYLQTIAEGYPGEAEAVSRKPKGA